MLKSISANITKDSTMPSLLDCSGGEVRSSRGEASKYDDRVELEGEVETAREGADLRKRDERVIDLLDEVAE